MPLPFPDIATSRHIHHLTENEWPSPFNPSDVVVGDSLTLDVLTRLSDIASWGGMPRETEFSQDNVKGVFGNIIKNKRELIAFQASHIVEAPATHKQLGSREVPIFYITPRALQPYAMMLVEDQAGPESLKLAAPTYLRETIFDTRQGKTAFGPYVNNIHGWMEMNNGFFFFANEKMFKKMTYLFGIKDLSSVTPPSRPGTQRDVNPDGAQL